ncbi:hypothetical protein EVJ58_g8564 [Rhodofomes roseus]|uniref:Uncharacterized protein n=1 Tax=Rhodofomes roseus TaxID=34475 RepID=A0A4Y9Y025_9APHY|nr:hypothetical protein EVJ58_g8564 [Rhodofomes roseus]
MVSSIFMVLSKEPSHNLQKLLKASGWLAHEQLCLSRRIDHNEEKEKSLFSDIYTIAQDTDVLRAMATCVRAMPIARAIKNVTEMGETVVVALSKRQHSRSSRSAPDDQFLSDDLDSTATTLIGRMVAETLIRAHTELVDLRNLDPKVRRVFITITSAMSVADGIDMCLLLFRYLTRPEGAEPETAVSQQRDRAMPYTIEYVTAMGEALLAILSNPDYPQSGASEPSSSEPGNSLQRGNSVGAVVAWTGRTVLDTFIRPQTELNDDTHALQLDSLDRGMLGGLIRAMPLADGIESEGDRRVDSTEAGDERAQDLPERRTDSPKRSITQHLGAVLRKLAPRCQKLTDEETPPVTGGSSNVALNTPGADTASPAASGANATMPDEPPHGQNKARAQTEFSQPIHATWSPLRLRFRGWKSWARSFSAPHADGSDVAREVTGARADAGEGPREDVRRAIEDADGHRGGDTGQDETADTGDAPAQSESRSESGNQNKRSG